MRARSAETTMPMELEPNLTLMTDIAPEFSGVVPERSHVPRLRTNVGISARVTVFLAAAGFGKTYAMIDAYERLHREGASVGWLSCAALVLPAHNLRRAIRRFFELFAEFETLFIDDLEILEPEQRRALVRAFALKGPSRKLVLATSSPDDFGLGKLLAGGGLRLIQAKTLRWRRRQLSELWHDRLTSGQIEFIDDIAQGWPIVSQLLAQFILEGGSRLPESALLNASLVTDYIRTEVLSSFRKTEVSALAMTSVVDAFDDELIRRVATTSRLTCDNLVRRLPGLCEYQGGGACIAYNRALALYLRGVFANLPDRARSQALRRAADWAAARDDLVSAVDLAARARDRKRIVDYVSKAGGIIATKNPTDLRAIVAAAGDTLVAQEPRLKLLKCVVLLKDGRVREASRLYQEARLTMPSDADTERAAAFIRLCLVICGCEVSLKTDMEVRQAARSLDQDPAYREIAPTILAIVHSQQANFSAATADIARARLHASEAATTYNLIYLDAHSTCVALACGKLEDARNYLSKARLRWRKDYSNDQAAETVVAALGAQLAFERGNIPLARRLIGQAGHRVVDSEAWLDIYFAAFEPMFRLLAREKGLQTALNALDRSIGQVRQAGVERIAAGLRNLASCMIGEDILKGAVGVSVSMVVAGRKPPLESWQERELRLLATAYRGLVTHRPERALHALDSAITFAEKTGLLRTQLRALLLRQVAKNDLGDRISAGKDFRTALEIGARTGMRQAFVEFGASTVKARLGAGIPEHVAAFAKSLERLLPAPPSDRSQAAFTRREEQILKLLTANDSDKGIAKKLRVTEHAVRFHLKNIYRKLAVHDRKAAADRYRPA